jgi:hypothetical protein
MIRTGTLGGDINHPEIRSEQTAENAEFAEISEFADLSWRFAGQMFINENAWSWPAAEALHFIGLSLLFGVAIVVNLRILGKLRSVPYTAVHRLLPIGVIGFLLCLVTGMLFYVGNAGRYIAVPEFGAKITLIVLAGLNLLYFTLFDQPWKIARDEDAPVFAKVVAVSTLAFLVGALYFGRMIPFLEF